jgi:hypothetical protein
MTTCEFPIVWVVVLKLKNVGVDTAAPGIFPVETPESRMK